MKLGDATTPAGGRRTGLTVAIGLGGVVSSVRMDPRPSLLLTNRSVTIMSPSEVEAGFQPRPSHQLKSVRWIPRGQIRACAETT